MRFKCPHCKHWIDTPPGHASKKANAARKRNAQLAGRKPVTPEEALEHVFLNKAGDAEPWTGASFQQAVKRIAGHEYSRSRAFAILQKLKKQYSALAKWRKRHPVKSSPDVRGGNAVTFRAYGSDAPGVPEPSQPKKSKKASH